MKSVEEWGKGKGVLIVTWHRFKGLEADAIVMIEKLVKDDVKVWVTRFLAQSLGDPHEFILWAADPVLPQAIR